MKSRVSCQLLLGCLLMSQVGCVQVPSFFSPFGDGQTGTLAAAQGNSDLPLREQANICRATAKQMEKAGKEIEAIHFYEFARAKDPNGQRVCRQLAVLYSKVGKFVESEREYKKALQLTPNNPELLADLGYSLYNQGRWQEAETKLRRALEIKPKNDRAWVNLGMTLGQLKKYPESLEAFKKAVPPAQAYCNLAFVFVTQGELAHAKAAYHSALREQPTLQLARLALSKLESDRTTEKVAPVSMEREVKTPAKTGFPNRQAAQLLPIPAANSATATDKSQE